MSNERVLNNEYGLAELQENLLVTLDALDDICRSNDVCYSLHGGTLLGAERNHHMIPWDDDIDISIKRSEYQKLKQIFDCGQIPEGFYLDETTMWFPRFVMKREEDPVYIDLLIWDYISERKLEQFIKINSLRFIQGMMKEEVDYSRFNIKGKILLGITQTVGKIVSNEKALKAFHKIQTERFLGSRKYIHRSNDSYRGCTYILDSKYMDGYTDIELEGKTYMANKRYKEFLVMEYGENYLTPPPISERQPGHVKFRESIKRKQNSE